MRPSRRPDNGVNALMELPLASTGVGEREVRVPAREMRNDLMHGPEGHDPMFAIVGGLTKPCRSKTDAAGLEKPTS